MKKVRRFRDSVESVLREREIASALEGTDDAVRTELDLEAVLYLVEHARTLRENRADIHASAALFRSVFNARFILLQAAPEGARLRHNDFDIPAALADNLTAPDGFYTKLSRIRFTRLFERNSPALQSLETQGHPPVTALIALPLIRNGRPTGCLAAALPEPLPLDSPSVLLLSIAAELVEWER